MIPLAPMMTFPEMVKVLSTFNVETLLPAPIVSDLHTELWLRSGWLAVMKLASPMMASTFAVGTPLVQLPALLQSLLTLPVQEVVAA